MTYSNIEFSTRCPACPPATLCGFRFGSRAREWKEQLEMNGAAEGCPLCFGTPLWSQKATGWGCSRLVGELASLVRPPLRSTISSCRLVCVSFPARVCCCLCCCWWCRLTVSGCVVHTRDRILHRPTDRPLFPPFRIVTICTPPGSFLATPGPRQDGRFVQLGDRGKLLEQGTEVEVVPPPAKRAARQVIDRAT